MPALEPVTPDGTVWVSAQLPVGGNAESVAKVQFYLTDIAAWEAVDAVFAEVFGDHRPARAVLQVAGLHHGFRVAADAVARRGRTERSEGRR
ncbi:RidA family protein [Streptomyces sp. NBC_01381]|uniref:RidA family protein n=1 Tax=Streptomyces sp. NBC_01381 TaxID=2903845 RepID=UPI00225BBE7A|nr:RidA family protein [Streptomyces sp. NBC_01381]MCX4672193.1 RidA family protein [Streptomyces sp. NBC_01381]